MNNLAVSSAAAGRTLEAIQLCEETLQLRKANPGPNHPDTLQSMNNLANFYGAAGRAQEALKLREETLQLRKAKVGPGHPDTLKAMDELANSYVVARRIQEALQLREETLQLMKAKLGPDHPDTLISMNNLALTYVAADRPDDALALLNETVQHRQRRLQSQPGNRLEQSFLAWTHGQMGEAEQARCRLAAAVKAYERSLELFTELEQDGALKHPFFREKMDEYRQRLALCRKAERAVKDLDFALQQPAAEVPQLLRMRVRYLLKEQKLPAAVETAAKMKERAGDQAASLYDAACLYALCAGAAKSPSPPAPLPEGARREKLADEAMRLLQQAVAKGYKNIDHLKKDDDLKALREREDYQKLVKELEEKK